MASTTPEDVRKAVNTAFEQVKTSLLAALGAGNLASQAVADAVNKAKERVTESSETARKNIEELPSEVESFREKLEPTELRKLLDEYTDAALKLYHKLAESGEETWEKIRTQPQVKKSFDQLEEALHAAQGRVDGVASDAKERVDEVFTRVTGRTREAGEEVATKVEDVAAKVEDVANEVADKVEDAAPKATEKDAPKTGTARKSGSPARKTNGSAAKTDK
ncbi:hypothetical protein BAY61_01745 [Prauserella marina]|uniref:Heparin binding hemagglutinin HbhA n=1 Tax=Prauserella marina TaxID=530584 RepID=A0A222VJ17_9PSEU|nr:hypothetical protein [Prauserella marina]ASR33926.1 hypothetical protein BAY61_01745 [Prauserella marina]PWV82524.1 heparin binding hemagglutinin HbhA [Prauserella marina]SDC71207.1 heparin binding hemagglutinin HbhA [Prauserella marina]